MGGSNQKLASELPLTHDEILSILEIHLSITTSSADIRYIIVADREYRLIDYERMKTLHQKGKLNKIIANCSVLAIFRAAGNFRRTVWGGARRQSSFLFIDTQKRVWVIDPVSGEIDALQFAYQIDQISSI